MPPRKAGARTAASRSKQTKAAATKSASSDTTLSKLNAQLSGLRVVSNEAKSKFVDDSDEVTSLPEDQIDTLLKNFDLETQIRIARLQNALSTRQAESRMNFTMAVQRVPHHVRHLSLESFLIDFGGDILTAQGGMGSSDMAPGVSTTHTGTTQGDNDNRAITSDATTQKGSFASALPATEVNEDWAALKAEVRAAGLRRAPSPTKSPTKRAGTARNAAPGGAPATRPGAAARPARVGETVVYTSTQGTPLQGVVLPDGRVRPLQPAMPLSPTGSDAGDAETNMLVQRIAAARQALGSSGSAALPSSPAPRRPGRVAAAAAALDRRMGTPSISGHRVAPPTSPAGKWVTVPASPSLGGASSPTRASTRTGGGDMKLIHLSNGRTLDPASISPSQLDALRISPAERARVRTQIAQWHTDQSQRWGG